jgi:DNA-binding transcriptional ArsR family regulator
MGTLTIPPAEGAPPTATAREFPGCSSRRRTQRASYNTKPGDPMPGAAKRELDELIYEKQVRICKAFASTTRLRILDLLAKREYTVSGLEHALEVSKTNVSQHLAILKAAGVVATRREGKQIYCSLAIPEVKQACQLIRDVLRAQIRNGRKLAL